MEVLMEHVGHGIGLILLLSMPAVLLAAGIGLIVGILQAVTQVQEQTIAAAPKLTFVFLLIIFGGPFMMDIMKDYLVESVHIGMEVIPHDQNMILPPKPRLAYGAAGVDRAAFFKEKPRIPTESKVKSMMSKPGKAFNETQHEAAVSTQSVTPRPKAGIGEKIFMKRRAAGDLPAPPKNRE